MKFNLGRLIFNILNLSLHNVVKTVPSTRLLNAASTEMVMIMRKTEPHLKADAIYLTPRVYTKTDF
jgi:hypothetical protein